MEKIFATDRICTHAEADLANGILSETGLTCPLHLSVFKIDDGVPQNPTCGRPITNLQNKNTR